MENTVPFRLSKWWIASDLLTVNGSLATQCHTPRMVLFPDPPAPAARPKPEQTAAEGPLGGRSYRYRGAAIDCQKGGHVCTLRMPDHPLHDRGFGSVGTVTTLVDLWLDERRLPNHMRLVASKPTRR